MRRAAEHLQLRVSSNLRISKDQFNTEKKYAVAAEGMARQDVKVEQYWQINPETKKLKLVWNVNIDDLNSDDYWQVRIDATSGAFVDKNNLTNYEKEPNRVKPVSNAFWPFSFEKPTIKVQIPQAIPAPVEAAYVVIPYPGRSPDIRPAEFVHNPWTLFGASNPATTLGWHSTADTDYDITRGNNVFAYMGTRPTDQPDPVYNWPDTTQQAGPSLLFGYSPDFTLAPNDSLNLTNKKFAISNLFYWTNMVHDISYNYGFTEAAGNFQTSNLGRGGEEGDHVFAQCQDGAGINNANFSTPPDGEPGRMRMYLWENPFLETVENGFAARYDAIEGRFNAPNKLVHSGPVAGNVVRYFNDPPGTAHPGCMHDNDLAGKIVITDNRRAPSCPNFTTMVTNAMNAGAIGMIIYGVDEIAFTPAGSVPTLNFPVVGVTNSVGTGIVNRLINNETVHVTLFANHRDGSLDNTIIAHEYMHGISNRLTGGGSAECLNNWEHGGEGWSDYLALMVTTDWDNPFTSGATPNGMAVYADEKIAGLRRYPYSTDMSIAPLTYADMHLSTGVHRIGEIWCSALWDMTWEIIAQKGEPTTGFLNNTGSGGNAIAMNLVMTGMKLQPCNPGFLESRDAILAADSLLYNGEFHCAIWRAFAKRGMGYSARQGDREMVGDELAGFDMPLVVQAIKETLVQNGSQFTITHTIKSSCLPLTGYVLRDSIPYGFNYISSTPSGVLQSGGILHFPVTDFAAGETKTFSITLETFAPGCKADTVIDDNRDGRSLGNLTPNVEYGVNGVWTAAGGGRSGQAWHAQEPSTASIINLVSDFTAMPPGKTLSFLSFHHSFNTEEFLDGGVVEYSTDGLNWVDLEPYFLHNDYTEEMLGPMFFGRKTFNGNSGGYQHSLVDLSFFGETPIRIRFRFASDEGTGGNGWLVDDVLRVNYCAAIMRSGLYEVSNDRLASQTVTTIYLGESSAALPLTLVSFEAKESGQNNLLLWKTESEINVQEFAVEFSTDGAQWNTIGVVAARNETVNQYTYTHTAPVNGANYYRLKMKDIDGSFKYSSTQIVRRQSGDKFFTLQPNPARGTAHFYFSGSLRLSTIRIFDGAGRLVKQAQLNPGSNYYDLPLGELAPGVYVAEAIGQSGKELLRFAVQK